MFDHPIIDVILGLVFFYVVLSLVASAIQEWVASLFALRSKNLWAGVQTLIGNCHAKQVYEHPLIRNLAKEGKKPSYIAPQTLSTVLVHIIAKETGNTSPAKVLLAKIPAEHPLKDILDTIHDDSQETLDAVRDNLAGWFDEGMDRISGWYKRQANIWTFGIAAVLTAATNASSIHIAEELWRNDALRAQIAAQAQAAAKNDNLPSLEATNDDTFKDLPIGWDNVTGTRHDWFKRLVGWLITTAAISLGAPFWFDLLGKVANLRGSGARPPTAQTS